MLKDFSAAIIQNKNLLMLFTVCIYVFALYGVFSEKSILFAILITVFFVFCVIKNLFSFKIIIIWALIFYFGVINTSARLKQTDELLNLAPVNSTIYGKIISIPEKKNENQTKFFFNVKKIEYDGKTKEFKNKEKIIVTLNTEEKLKIYDSYKITGRLSAPFKVGNPSQFDYGNYLRNFSAYSSFYGRNSYSMKDSDALCYEKLSVKNSKAETYLQNINSYRERILKIHSGYLKSPNLEILGGIVFGDDAVSPPENIKQSFINSGLLHILAASGMNVAFIYAFFFFFLNLVRVPFKANIITCIAAVLIYVLMTGLGASIIRAALMLLFVLIGKMINRDAHSISLLFFVGFLILVYNPMYLNDVGFQLSFIVTFGLLVTIPLIAGHKNRILNWLIGTITVPVIAQLWVIPIQIFYFNNITIYSVFANIISVSILSVISFGGFISSLLCVITPLADTICKTFDMVLNPLITTLVSISDFWGNLPNSTLQTTHPSPLQMVLYYLILLGIIFLFKREENFQKYRNFAKIIIPSFLVIILLSLINIPDKNLSITTFDVGNADSFLVKTPDNKYMMIDTGKSGYNGGKSQAEILLLKYFKDKGIKNLETIIVTHFDNDHSGGAADLLNNLTVKTLYVNSLNHPSENAKTIYKIAKENKVNIIEAKNNQIIYEKSPLVIKNYIIPDIAGVGDNESSIITLLKYGDFSMLFTGDAGVETLYKLKEVLPKNLTVLKVGHHGASGVINKELAEYFNPKYSIISTGENKFGHPSVYTVNTLKNSKVLRTDINNSIKINVNPNDFKIMTYNPKKKKYE